MADDKLGMKIPRVFSENTPAKNDIDHTGSINNTTLDLHVNKNIKLQQNKFINTNAIKHTQYFYFRNRYLTHKGSKCNSLLD